MANWVFDITYADGFNSRKELRFFEGGSGELLTFEPSQPLNSSAIQRLIHSWSAAKCPFCLEQQPDDPAIIQNPSITRHTLAVIRSSGTTAKAKWIPINRAQVEASVLANSRNQQLLPEPDRAWLLSLPLTHTGGLAVLLRSACHGNKVVVAKSPKVEHIAQSLLKHGSFIQTLSLVPTQLKRLLERQELILHLKAKKAILLGGGPVSEALRVKIHALQLPVIYSYGMSESFGQLFSIPAAELALNELNANIVGHINHGQAFRIDEDGQILVRGPQLFEGYLRHEGINRNAKQVDGWFATGDIGQLNQKHQLEILMRRTDLIVSGGENLSPAEIEAKLAHLTGIEQEHFAVVGLPDEEWGEIACLCIEQSALSPSHSMRSIQEAIQQLQPTHLRPKRIQWLDSFPRTSLGKIMRFKLKSLLIEVK